MNPPLYIDMIASPLGVLLLAHCSGYLCALDFQDHEARFRRLLARRFSNITLEQKATPDSIRAPLDAYLNSADMEAVKEVPLHACGTRFQQQVWKMLRRIPAGNILSSTDIARAIGHPSAAAEVEQAAARNPIAIIVPCHRATAGSGELTGYVGGTARKRWLLTHEGALATAGEVLASVLSPLQRSAHHQPILST